MNISTLKAKLSAYLDRVRHGQRVTVVDRKTAIAEIVPLPAGAPRLVVRPAAEPPSAIGRVRGVRLRRPVDVDAVLADSRGER